MLEKLKKIKVNFALLLLLAYLAKLVIFSADYPDALIIACLTGLYGYKMKLKALEPKPVDDNLKKDVQELKNAFSKLNLAKITEPKKYF